MKTPILQGVYLKKAGCLNLLIDRHVLFLSKKPKTIEIRQKYGFFGIEFSIEQGGKIAFLLLFGETSEELDFQISLSHNSATKKTFSTNFFQVSN